jgi:two-component system LytT family sensor kinase
LTVSVLKTIARSSILPLLGHLAFWGFFLALPFLLRTPPPPPDSPKVVISDEFIILLYLCHVPLFYLNANVLIPKVLKRHGASLYVVSVLLTIAAALALNVFLKLSLIPGYPARIGVWSLFPVIFVLAISTMYRVLTDYLSDERQRKESENERLKSELSFLRSQISPHFMFNVLNSIVSLARKKSELVEPVVIQLSDLMRYMLYESDGTKVTLKKEIKYLLNYMELQRLRFGSDVETRMEVDDQLPHQLIEPMLLIPFVENAFKHGVGLIDQPVIELTLQAKDNSLFFQVRNRVNRRFQEHKDRSSGIGLPNVKRRLSLLYPDSHRLDIREDADWYEVSLTIRFREESPAALQPRPAEAVA